MTKLSKKARVLRTQFTQRYGKQTMKIVKRVAKGMDSHEIADDLDINLTTVVTTRGNLTRGTYAPFVYVQDNNVVGCCKY